MRKLIPLIACLSLPVATAAVTGCPGLTNLFGPRPGQQAAEAVDNAPAELEARGPSPRPSFQGTPLLTLVSAVKYSRFDPVKKRHELTATVGVYDLWDRLAVGIASGSFKAKLALRAAAPSAYSIAVLGAGDRRLQYYDFAAPGDGLSGTSQPPDFLETPGTGTSPRPTPKDGSAFTAGSPVALLPFLDLQVDGATGSTSPKGFYDLRLSLKTLPTSVMLSYLVADVEDGKRKTDLFVGYPMKNVSGLPDPGVPTPSPGPS